MKRLAILICAIVLASCPYLVAQLPAGQIAGAAKRPAGAGPGESPESKDFDRLLGVQATPTQASQFQSLAKSTEAARKQAQDLLQQLQHSNTAHLAQPIGALKSALEKAQSDNANFLKGFAAAQKSGLKELIRKLAKADSELSKQEKALDSERGHGKPDNKRLAAFAEKLQKAVTDFQSVQLSLGNEMAIDKPSM